MQLREADESSVKSLPRSFKPQARHIVSGSKVRHKSGLITARRACRKGVVWHPRRVNVERVLAAADFDVRRPFRASQQVMTFFRLRQNAMLGLSAKRAMFSSVMRNGYSSRWLSVLGNSQRRTPLKEKSGDKEANEVQAKADKHLRYTPSKPPG